MGLKTTLAGTPAMARNQLMRRRTASWKTGELVPGKQSATSAVELMGTYSDVA